MTMPTHTLETAPAAAAAGRGALVPGLCAGLLGLVLLWGVGFAPISAVHNAAHDARHSNVFPCH
jgi:cobalt transporter subunit CbtB